MKKHLFLVLSLIPLLSIAQETDRWKYIGKSSDGEKYYIDTQTMTSNSGWIKSISSPMSKSNVHTIVAHQRASCTNRTLSAEQVINYDKNGRPIKTSNIYDPPSQVAPNTIGEMILETICSNVDLSEWLGPIPKHSK